jgi:hypothetical protein
MDTGMGINKRQVADTGGRFSNVPGSWRTIFFRRKSAGKDITHERRFCQRGATRKTTAAKAHS